MSQITVFPSHGDSGDTIVGRSRDTIMLTKIAKTVRDDVSCHKLDSSFCTTQEPQYCGVKLM